MKRRDNQKCLKNIWYYHQVCQIYLYRILQIIDYAGFVY